MTRDTLIMSIVEVSGLRRKLWRADEKATKWMARNPRKALGAVGAAGVASGTTLLRDVKNMPRGLKAPAAIVGAAGLGAGLVAAGSAFSKKRTQNFSRVWTKNLKAQQAKRQALERKKVVEAIIEAAPRVNMLRTKLARKDMQDFARRLRLSGHAPTDKGARKFLRQSVAKYKATGDPLPPNFRKQAKNWI